MGIPGGLSGVVNAVCLFWSGRILLSTGSYWSVMSAMSFAGLLPEFGTLTPGAAARWVAAVLAEANVLREYDGWLYPTDRARQHTAERLHEAWRAWLDEAQTLLQQAEPLTSNGGTIRDLEILRELIARTR